MMELAELTTALERRALDGRGAARGRREQTSLIVELRMASGAIGRGEAVGPCESSLLFAIETALLAAAADERGTSIGELLAPDRVIREPRVSRVVDDPDEAVEWAAAGCRDFKIKVCADDASVARVAAIARAVPTARLRLDANQQIPLADATDALARFAAICDRIDYIEEPCVDSCALATSARPLALRIALDESLATLTPAILDRGLASGRVAALVLKPAWLGGMHACLALADRARAAGVRAIVTHALEGPIGRAACWELARAIGGDDAHGVARD